MIQSLIVLQHVPYEGPARVEKWAKSRGIPVQTYRVFDGVRPSFPKPGEGLLILGGPMNIFQDDAYPWLAWEREFITHALANDVPMLGICLGAQFIAHAGGAKVRKHDVREIGWMPVEFTDAAIREESGLPLELVVLHWHGDTFDVPVHARAFARSAACANQAFLLGRSLALQFHPEVTHVECEEIIAHSRAKLLEDSPSVQSEKQIRDGLRAYGGRVEEILFRLLDWHFRVGACAIR